VNGKNPPSSAATAPSEDVSPLTDTPVLSKLSSVLHSEGGSGQQFKSARLQQLLAARTSTADSITTSTAVKSGDSVVPAENEAGAPANEKLSDNDDTTLEVSEV